MDSARFVAELAVAHRFDEAEQVPAGRQVDADFAVFLAPLELVGKVAGVATGARFAEIFGDVDGNNLFGQWFFFRSLVIAEVGRRTRAAGSLSHNRTDIDGRELPTN
jgi:hypothetical protein